MYIHIYVEAVEMVGITFLVLTSPTATMHRPELSSDGDQFPKEKESGK